MRDPLTKLSKRALRRHIVKLEEKIEHLMGERQSIIDHRDHTERLYAELRAEVKEARRGA